MKTDSPTLPVVVPEHVTAALHPGETAMFDADTGEWLGLRGDTRRTLGRRPLRPMTRADARSFRGRVAAMNPADHELVDEMRRFYERGGVAS